MKEEKNHCGLFCGSGENRRQDFFFPFSLVHHSSFFFFEPATPRFSSSHDDEELVLPLYLLWLLAFRLSKLASIPYRFKGSSGANMAAQAVHHHRSTTKSSNKPYKSRHASKGSVKDKEKGAQWSLALNDSYGCEKDPSNDIQAKWSGALAGPLTSNSSPSSTGETRLARDSN